MRLAYLSASGGLGGAERCLVDLLAVVRQFEPSWHLHVIVPSEGPLAGAARRRGVGVTVVPLPGPLARLGDARATIGWPLARRLMLSALTAPSYARSLTRCLADIRPDLVHSNSIKTHVLGVTAAPRGVPVLWHLHDFIGARPVSSRLLRLLSRRRALPSPHSRPPRPPRPLPSPQSRAPSQPSRRRAHPSLRPPRASPLSRRRSQPRASSPRIRNQAPARSAGRRWAGSSSPSDTTSA